MEDWLNLEDEPLSEDEDIPLHPDLAATAEHRDYEPIDIDAEPLPIDTENENEENTLLLNENEADALRDQLKDELLAAAEAARDNDEDEESAVEDDAPLDTVVDMVNDDAAEEVVDIPEEIAPPTDDVSVTEEASDWLAEDVVADEAAAMLPPAASDSLAPDLGSVDMNDWQQPAAEVEAMIDEMADGFFEDELPAIDEDSDDEPEIEIIVQMDDLPPMAEPLDKSEPATIGEVVETDDQTAIKPSTAVTWPSDGPRLVHVEESNFTPQPYEHPERSQNGIEPVVRFCRRSSGCTDCCGVSSLAANPSLIVANVPTDFGFVGFFVEPPRQREQKV